MGPLALASTDLPIVAAESAVHPDVATIPTMGAEVEESPALADDDQPMTGDLCCFPVETGCPANGSWQMSRNSGCLLWS